MQSQKKEHTEELEIGTCILTEANQKLKNALKSKDYKAASIAQALIESAEQKVSNAKNLMSIQEKNKSNFKNGNKMWSIIIFQLLKRRKRTKFMFYI